MVIRLRINQREQNMTLVAVEEVIARIPMWQNTTDLKVSLLRGGITNHNYRVDVGGKSFVSTRRPNCRINREYEYSTSSLPANWIAPEVYFLSRRLSGDTLYRG
jgi:hypothetical protein